VSTRRTVSMFWLRAVVEGKQHLAAWLHSKLIVHRDVAARAELLIQMGKVSPAPEPIGPVPAGLDEPIQAALTLMHASDRILEFSLRVDDLAVAYQAERSAGL
jgi:hypothetical protein